MSDFSTITTKEQAEQFITERYTEATEYADNAWEKLSDFLADMREVFTDLDIPANFAVDEADLPDLTLETIDIDDIPEFNDLLELDRDGTLDAAAYDLVLADITTALTVGGTGFSTTAQEAMFQNAVLRGDYNHEQVHNEAQNYFAARDYELPPGALAGRLLMATVEKARADNIISNEITTVVAQQEQKNRENALTAGVNLFLVQVEKYKAEINSIVARIEGLARAYIARIEAIKAKFGILTAEQELKIKEYEARSQIILGKKDLMIKEAEMRIREAANLLAMRVEAAKIGGSVTAQVVASALSSVNASTNYGYTGGFNSSFQYDETKGEDSGASTVHYHYYEET